MERLERVNNMEPAQNPISNNNQTVNPAPQSAAPATTPAQKPPKNYLIPILMVAIVLVLLGIVGFFLMGSKKQTSLPYGALNKSSTQITPQSGQTTEVKQVDSITIDDTDKDFSDVEKDLQQL